MKRDCLFDNFDSCVANDSAIFRQVAFHEAGHAAAIHFFNKQKQLPPIFFQITVKYLPHFSNEQLAGLRLLSRNHYIGMIEGGYLIQNLPVTLLEHDNYTLHEQLAYQIAFEADMVNLMIGPLAEAKHVFLRNNGIFMPNQLDINIFSDYCGTSDLGEIREYLDILVPDKREHPAKLTELFNCAMMFIESPKYWHAIECLADLIFKSDEESVGCEEAIAVMEASLVRKLGANSGILQ